MSVKYHFLTNMENMWKYEPFLEAKKGKFVLGGCCVDENSPNWACKSCNHKFKDS